jgi:hypothetical protein
LRAIPLPRRRSDKRKAVRFPESFLAPVLARFIDVGSPEGEALGVLEGGLDGEAAGPTYEANKKLWLKIIHGEPLPIYKEWVPTGSAPGLPKYMM